MNSELTTTIMFEIKLLKQFKLNLNNLNWELKVMDGLWVLQKSHLSGFISAKITSLESKACLK